MAELNTYGDVSPRTGGYATKELLKRGQEMMILERFGQFDPQGKNKTKTRRWRRYLCLPPATSPLAEGVTPPGQKLRYQDVNVTLEQYGDWVQITDVIQDTHEDPVLNEAIDICSEQAAETIELLRFYVLRAGSNVYYAAGVTSRATVDSPAINADLRKVYRGFRRAKAKPISKIIKASPFIGTEPVRSAFFGLCHSDCEADLYALGGFVPVEKYSNADKAMVNEFGKFENFRFLSSSLFDPWETAGASGTTYLSGGVEVSVGANCDVYPILLLAKDAYGIVPLQGENAIKPAVKNPMPAPGDPLGQRGFVSWKTYQASVILNQLWMARLEVAVTANPTS